MGNLPKYMCYANAKRNFFGLFSVGFITVKNILGKQFRATLVDLHLRTKADLYSFMQGFITGSFVKIQDLIGYVSKYMLNAT